MNSKNSFKIDFRTIDDIHKQINSLATSYTPEWIFDTKNPDTGSVIGLIFANQLEENIKKVNQVIDKYHTEFVNLLNIGLLPAYPAHGIAVMELIEDTISGVEVPKGTKLLGNAEDEKQVVFETMSDVYITNSKISDIVAVSRTFGKIIPIKGEMRPQELFPYENSLGEGSNTIEQLARKDIPVFSLFDYAKEGIEKNGLALYHKSVFDTAENVSISILITDVNTNTSIGEKLTNSSCYKWSYYGEEGLTLFDKVTAKDGVIVLEKNHKSRKINYANEEYDVIYVEAVSAVIEPVEVGKVLVSSECGPVSPVFVSHNSEDLETNKFMPFGELVSVFDECFIGHDSIFSQQGAMVTINFNLSLKEKLVSLSPILENEELKIIKRKPRAVLFETAHTSPQRITFEYYNGMGWRRLNCTQDMSSVFSGNYHGEVTISFICPEDWQPMVIGGYEQRAIRIRVVQADNCYLQPCIHKMPVIENMTIQYSYFGQWKIPHRLRRVCGTKIFDESEKVFTGMPFVAFSPFLYSNNSVFFGFDRKMTGAPVSIFFDIEESAYFDNARVQFEYSTMNGFQEMKVIDHTENMTRAGTILFVPPSDFAKVEVEGQVRFWIKIVDKNNAFDNPENYRPVIRSIRLNAVEIYNVETLEEEQFYIDVTRPNMSFPIAAENILTADVFVNEKNRLSNQAIKQMIDEQPENVRVEYNFLGEISSFFVRWHEVKNFDNSNPVDRHYIIDRMNNTINFGNGVSVMIPLATEGIAFTVQAKCCNGEKGNLPIGAVNTVFGRILYVNNVENPIATFAGSNIESIESAHQRGANMISSQNRLVSELDFVREVSSFSTSISKVKCVVGEDVEGGKSDDVVSIVLMMQDYADGSYSFNSVKDRLKNQLLFNCETTLSRDTLRITEPIYVKISVDVWVEVENGDSFFEVQNTIKESIAQFLDPLGSKNKKGWDIGTLPSEEQIKMMLRPVNNGFTLRHTVVSAKYFNKLGVHECDISSLKGNPFMIGCSGTHTVHMMLPK